MELRILFDIVLHLDQHLAQIIQTYGTFTYGILFFIIFAETGFVVTPFLPGDSLLFAVGALSTLGVLDPMLLFFLLATAAIAGDTINYWAGYLIGPKIFRQRHTRFLNKEYLERTHKFYDKYGGKIIILARFIPFIRTFAPFVAGIGRMNYGRFLTFNIFGGVVWIGLFVFSGYFFGNIPFIKNNFGFVVIIIIFLSIMPLALEFWNKNRQI